METVPRILAVAHRVLISMANAFVIAPGERGRGRETAQIRAFRTSAICPHPPLETGEGGGRRDVKSRSAVSKDALCRGTGGSGGVEDVVREGRRGCTHLGKIFFHSPCRPTIHPRRTHLSLSRRMRSFRPLSSFLPAIRGLVESSARRFRIYYARNTCRR